MMIRCVIKKIKDLNQNKSLPDPRQDPELDL